MRLGAIYLLTVLCLATSAALAQEVPKEEQEAFDELREAAKNRRHAKVEKWHLEWLKIKARRDCLRVHEGETLWKWLTAPSREYLLRELLYSIPRLDDPLPVLRTFRRLWSQDPKACHVFPDLAVAFATVWTRPKAVRPFDDTKRLGATPAAAPADMLDSFAWYVQNARELACDPRRFPWQLLLYVANNTAPIEERQWALETYAKLPVPYGRLYKEVPYDFAVITGKGRPRMAGKAYTLANLKAHGGVCSHQADYAEKVLRSLGIPAMQVRGQSRYGGYHAWIGWFEPAGAGRASRYRFFGNYQIDRFYTGSVLNPTTGKWDAIDRDIELAVLAMGQGAASYRRARTLHRCYLSLYRLGKDDRLRLLTDAVKANPYYGPAWLTLGELCHRGKLTEAEGLKLINVMLRRFAAFPDLTFRVLGNFAALLPVDDVRKINTLFTQAYGVYRRAQRPDLATRLKIAQGEVLAAAGHYEHAIKALAQGASDYPTEGRTVGRLAQGIGHICRDRKRPDLGLKLLVPLLKKVPKHARTKPVPLPNRAYVAVASEVVSLYRETGDAKKAQELEREIAALKGGE